MTKLEEHLEGIRSIFQQYSGESGNPDKLTKGEVKQLLTNELPNTLKNTKDQAAVGQMFQDLDNNKKVLLSLDDFLKLVASVLVLR
ncbi:protein S100-A12 [Tenrec ecaudatus]|uniref:protein S100-A12 n=1 Tax=Tenrec ecaudatus TaxID=94439 RepID=UPI003F59EA2C